MSGKRCHNCTIDFSPVWRQARDLGVTLCNACHICWTSKGVHRFKPSPQELARTKAAAANKKVAPMAHKPVDVGAGYRSGTQEAAVGAKRKRMAKNWGEDQECYGEGTLGRSDSNDSMDWEISVQTHVASFEATPKEDRLNVFGAAKVLGSLKRAKHSHTSEEEGSDRSTARVSRRNVGRRESPPSDVTTSEGAKQRPQRRARAVAQPNAPPKTCLNCGAIDTPVWRRVDGAYPFCNACGVAKQNHGVHRIPPAAMAAPAACLPPPAVVAPMVPPAPVVPELPAAPALTCSVPLFKPLAWVTDFHPFRVDSPSAVRVPMPKLGVRLQGVALFAEPKKFRH